MTTDLGSLIFNIFSLFTTAFYEFCQCPGVVQLGLSCSIPYLRSLRLLPYLAVLLLYFHSFAGSLLYCVLLLTRYPLSRENCI